MFIKMLNISRARVYDTTQWASLPSADLLMEMRIIVASYNFHTPAVGMEDNMSINQLSAGVWKCDVIIARIAL